VSKIYAFTKITISDSMRHLLALHLNCILIKYLEGIFLAFGVLREFIYILFAHERKAALTTSVALKK
jgi:hypothetical protein